MKSTVVIRYWGRKAGEIAEPYLSKYSKYGDTVLDPFGGAGGVIKTALSLGRRAIYSDINSLAALIARVEIEGVDLLELNDAFDQLLNDSLLEAYKVNCHCGSQCEVLYYIWEKEKFSNARIHCRCGNTLTRHDGLNQIDPNSINFPIFKLWYNESQPFWKRRQVNYIHELYSKRNLVILSRILTKIKLMNVSDKTKRGLYVAFASILYQASNMSRAEGGTWGVNSYWIPRIHVERNPFRLMKNALQRLGRIDHVSTAVQTIEEFEGLHAPLCMLNQDCTKLQLSDESVDMVITDPPFTSEIQYYELSVLAASWLGLPMSYKDEIIVNPKQGKSINCYFDKLSLSIKEMNRVLKSNGVAVLMLHDEKAYVLKRIRTSIIDGGFDVIGEEIIQMPQRNIGNRDSSKGKELLILTCKKHRNYM